MQLGGNPKDVELTKDLTRYDSRLTVGQKGKTIPNRKIGMWGSSDTFVAVKFDCGAVLDIAYNSLNINVTEKEFDENLKTATDIVVTRGIRGGFKHLSYKYTGDVCACNCGNSFKKESEKLIAHFESLGKKIEVEYV